MPSIKPVVYWRPGCPFCTRLIAGLDDADVAYDQVNIWESPEGAAFVRSVANGNETVPTVLLGDVAHVNPSPQFVIDAVR